jgi:hypothetical protein
MQYADFYVTQRQIPVAIITFEILIYFAKPESHLVKLQYRDR